MTPNSQGAWHGATESDDTSPHSKGRELSLLVCVFLCGCNANEAAHRPAGHQPTETVVVEQTESVDSALESTETSREPDNTSSSSTNTPSPTPQYKELIELTLQAAAQPQPVYRPSDSRPQHDDRQLMQFGIRRYESKRLRLYTDIAAEKAETLPRFIDAAYDAWEDYLGSLPPDREGTPFQITGYLMSDKQLFRDAGLIPNDLPDFVNGRHKGAEFWMLDQEHDYYRRHLMIHEATHCYMTIMPGTEAPWWYLEGVAEQFGTHRIDADGTIHFRVMPHDRRDFRGLGRIKMVQDDVAQGRFRELEEFDDLQPQHFLQDDTYAWSWALCEFLSKHPRYRDRFRRLVEHTTGRAFDRAFREFFDRDAADLKTEWPLFAHHLQHGYDHERAAIEFHPGKPLDADPGNNRAEIAADRGWQSSGLRVEAGRRYEVSATGRFTLADDPKPWISEPQGVSVRYWKGRPLGMLLASIRSDLPSDGSANESLLRVIPVGSRATFAAPTGGTLYFRVNDSWSELADNTGCVQIEVRESP